MDTKTDKQGQYCLNVPLSHDRIDLKVWGLTYIKKENYICQGGKNGIDLGSTPRKCGEGCMEIMWRWNVKKATGAAADSLF